MSVQPRADINQAAQAATGPPILAQSVMPQQGQQYPGAMPQYVHQSMMNPSAGGLPQVYPQVCTPLLPHALLLSSVCSTSIYLMFYFYLPRVLLLSTSCSTSIYLVLYFYLPHALLLSTPCSTSIYLMFCLEHTISTGVNINETVNHFITLC